MRYIVELTEEDVEAYKMLVRIGTDASVSGHAVANGVPYKENPTGRWQEGQDALYCSVCGETAIQSDWGGDFCKTNFCPTCGARMTNAEWAHPKEVKND